MRRQVLRRKWLSKVNFGQSRCRTNDRALKRLNSKAVEFRHRLISIAVKKADVAVSRRSQIHQVKALLAMSLCLEMGLLKIFKQLTIIRLSRPKKRKRE